MTDVPAPPGGDWSGPAGFVVATGAIIRSFFGRGMSPHKVRNEIAQVVLPLLPRLAVLESKYAEIDRRLIELAAGQIRMDDKLERLLER